MVGRQVELVAGLFVVPVEALRATTQVVHQGTRCRCAKAIVRQGLVGKMLLHVGQRTVVRQQVLLQQGEDAAQASANVAVTLHRSLLSHPVAGRAEHHTILPRVVLPVHHWRQGGAGAAVLPPDLQPGRVEGGIAAPELRQGSMHGGPLTADQYRQLALDLRNVVDKVGRVALPIRLVPVQEEELRLHHRLQRKYCHHYDDDAGAAELHHPFPPFQRNWV